MTATTDTTSRTAHLLELMTSGDEAFNAHDFAAVDGFARGPLLRRRLLGRGRRWSRVVHATRAFEDRAAGLPRTVRKSKRVSPIVAPHGSAGRAFCVAVRI